MANVVYLKDFLEDGENYEEKAKMFIKYAPDEEKISFSKRRTGWDRDQFFETEKFDAWHPVLVRGRVYLISDNITYDDIHLSGEKGYKNGLRIIKEYCTLYGCKSIGAIGEALTEEIFEELPKSLKTEIGWYWLLNKDSGYNMRNCFHKNGDTYSGIKYVSLRNEVECDNLIYDGMEYNRSNNVRPFIALPTEICVDLCSEYYDGSTPERGLMLKVG